VAVSLVDMYPATWKEAENPFLAGIMHKLVSNGSRCFWVERLPFYVGWLSLLLQDREVCRSLWLICCFLASIYFDYHRILDSRQNDLNATSHILMFEAIKRLLRTNPLHDLLQLAFADFVYVLKANIGNTNWRADFLAATFTVDHRSVVDEDD